MKKIDIKNLFAAAFFVTALLIAGVGHAFENNSRDARTAMLCDCSRSGFSSPHCKVLENTPFPGAEAKQKEQSHGVMPQRPAAIQQRNTAAE